MRIPLTARPVSQRHDSSDHSPTSLVSSSPPSPSSPSSNTNISTTSRPRTSSANSFFRNLSRLRSSSSSHRLSMFRQKWTNSGPPPPPSSSSIHNTHHHHPSSASASAPALRPIVASASSSSRTSVVFPLPGRRSSTRSSAQNEDAYITLSHPSLSHTANNKHDIVTDDELRDGRRLHARFNMVPVTDSAVSDCSTSESGHSNPDDNCSSTTGTSTTSFTQAGGHDGSFQTDGATLTKKVTERETKFYEAALEGAWPTQLLPKYYGRVGDNAIRIENLTHGFRRPCVVDLKIGIQTVESDEKLLKRVKMTTLDALTGSRSEGCRLEGLSMFRTLDKRNVNLKGSKRQTHGISADVRVSLQDVLTFFLTDESGVRTDLALRFQTSIEQILKRFEQNNRYLFIGSSILLIYDNDNQSPHMRWARALRKLHTIAPHVRLSEDQISGLTRRTLCDVRMIDFAHTGPLPPGQRRDEGYIRGLRSILRALKAIRVYRSKPIFSFQSAAIDMMEEQRAKSLAAQGRGEPSQDGEGDFTFKTVLRELTAVSHIDDDDSL